MRYHRRLVPGALRVVRGLLGAEHAVGRAETLRADAHRLAPAPWQMSSHGTEK